MIKRYLNLLTIQKSKIKDIFFTAFFSLCIFIYASCAGQKAYISYPEPGYKEGLKQDILIDISEITETKNGTGTADFPDWLTAYVNGGIAEVEKMDFFYGKYCYLGVNESGNFDSLIKWADNYSITRDFSRLAAARIEKRLVNAASLYPDDEYGNFYEMIVKKAYDTEYQEAVMEDTYWIKSGDDYKFFVFISIDIVIMRAIIEKMIAETLASAAPTRVQNASISRLQHIFFEGF
jgi:hypothetical protein